jgi:putative DNA primase/helicase
LNWALAGFKRLNENGMFSKSQSAEALAKEYRSDNNHVASFVDEECMLESSASAEKGRLYLKYLAYCSENNFKPFNKRNFGKELKAYFKQVEDGHGTGNIAIWKGIALS